MRGVLVSSPYLPVPSEVYKAMSLVWHTLQPAFCFLADYAFTPFRGNLYIGRNSAYRKAGTMADEANENHTVDTELAADFDLYRRARAYVSARETYLAATSVDGVDIDLIEGVLLPEVWEARLALAREAKAAGVDGSES